MKTKWEMSQSGDGMEEKIYLNDHDGLLEAMTENADIKQAVMFCIEHGITLGDA